MFLRGILIIIIGIIILMSSMGTTTISLSENVRKELLRVAAQLQAKRGAKVDYDQVIQYLLSRVGKRDHLLREACQPVPVAVSELREEFRRARSEDRRREKALETKYT